MRTQLRTGLAVAGIACAAALGATAQPDSPGTSGGPELLDTSCNLYDGVEDVAARTGAFYPKFWPNGIVPYEFEDGSGATVGTRFVQRNDVTFRIPFDGPELVSPTGFPTNPFNINHFNVGDVIQVSGSRRNDNRNMEIVEIRNGPGGDTLKVELGPLSTFSAESPDGSFITVFETDGVGQPRRDLVEQAMTIWEAAANITFVPRTTQTDYVLIENGTVNSVRGDVGYEPGERTLIMNAWISANVEGIIVHELGHSLGLKHEHQRPDRNNYVSIDTTIIQQQFLANFPVDNGITIYPNLTYDFGSIMHYSQNAARQNGATGTVITVLEPWTDDWQLSIGQRDSLSYWDKTTMSFMYPRSNWRFLREDTPSNTNDGGFLTPWKTFQTAYAGTPTWGRLYITHPDDYVAPGVYSKAMTIKAPQGGVILRGN